MSLYEFVYVSLSVQLKIVLTLNNVLKAGVMNDVSHTLFAVVTMQTYNCFK